MQKHIEAYSVSPSLSCIKKVAVHANKDTVLKEEDEKQIGTKFESILDVNCKKESETKKTIVSRDKWGAYKVECPQALHRTDI